MTDSEIILIMRKLLKYIVITAAFIVCGCGDSFNQAQDYLTGPVNGVGLKSSTSVVSGGTEQLFPVVSPPKTSNKKVTWSSDNSSIVSVDSNGIITGVATPDHEETETAIITVTTDDGGYTAQCTVTVTEKPVAVTGVSLSSTTTAIEVGGQVTLIPEITPSVATNQNLTWKSSNSRIVTVESNGVVTAVKAGTATVTVTTVDGGFKAICTVTVTTDPVFFVTYDSNTGTGSVPVDSTGYVEGSEVTVMSGNTLVKTSYNFAGWNTSSDGSGTAYAVGETFLMETYDLTLYAQWNLTAPSGLSYSTPSAIYLVGQLITDNVPAKTGTVTSWSINPALPAGLSFNTTTGVISGTPASVHSATLYTITASNSGGSTTATILITVNITVPDAPSVTAGVTQLSLTWAAVTGATSYEVWYNTANTTTGAIQQGGNISGTSYTITGLTNETLYYIWLRAKIASDTSGYSTVAIGIPAAYIIGSTGPGGGIVFYVKSMYTSDGNGVWRYLEAAPADQSGGIEWSNVDDTLIGTTGKAIGTGKTNTAKIMAQSGASSGAAFVCHNYSGGSYTDWFLPSQDELNAVYLNRAIIGGFTTDYYWSSSETTDGSYSYIHDFYDGSMPSWCKWCPARVRPIRAF